MEDFSKIDVLRKWLIEHMEKRRKSLNNIAREIGISPTTFLKFLRQVGVIRPHIVLIIREFAEKKRFYDNKYGAKK